MQTNLIQHEPMAQDSWHWVGDAVAAHVSLVHQLAGGTPTGPLSEILEWAKQAARRRPGFLRLPLLTCQATGGEPVEAVPVAAAWHLFFCAAQLVDDVADQAEIPLSPSLTINAAFGLTFLGQLSLSTADHARSPAAHSLALLDLFNRAAVRVVEGQAADLAWDARTATLDDYWHMIGAKGGEWFALACRAGALCGFPPHDADRYGTFGYHLGVLIQLSDDLGALWRPRGRGDLATLDRTLPVVYGLTVGPPAMRDHLVEMLAQPALDDASLDTLRSVLADLGALHYLALQARHHAALARETILASPHAHLAHDDLLAIVDSVFPAVTRDSLSPGT